MHIGVGMFATDYAIPIDELARETEARGFESLWVPEHTHIPTSRRTPWPGGSELHRCQTLRRRGAREAGREQRRVDLVVDQPVHDVDGGGEPAAHVERQRDGLRRP